MTKPEYGYLRDDMSHKEIGGRDKWSNALDAIPTHDQPFLSANQIFSRQEKPRLPRALLYPMLETMAGDRDIDEMKAGRMHYYRRRSETNRITRQVTIEEGDGTQYNEQRRNKFSLDPDIDWLYQAVHPISRGKTVKLWMELPALRQASASVKKPRSSNLVNKKLVVLVPGYATGLPRDTLLVSVIGSGSTLLSPSRKDGIANLVLAGMPARLAKELMNVVRRILKE